MDATVTIQDADGGTVGIDGFPPEGTTRWGFKKKTLVIRAVTAGMLTLQEALDRYHMTEREFRLWEKGLSEDGTAGLMLTKFQHRRRARK